MDKASLILCYIVSSGSCPAQTEILSVTTWTSITDLVISNCVINLTTDKVPAFKEIYRILKVGGRMIISDLVTDKGIDENSVNPEKWCSCIDGALTRENYLDSIREAGFNNPEVALLFFGTRTT